MDKQKWYIDTVEYYSSIKSKEVLIEAAPWMSPGNIMLSEISQTHNESYGMALLLLLLLSRFSHVRLCVTPETAAHQAPLSLGFSRQEHWSGLPFPSPMHGSEK